MPKINLKTAAPSSISNLPGFLLELIAYAPVLPEEVTSFTTTDIGGSKTKAAGGLEGGATFSVVVKNYEQGTFTFSGDTEAGNVISGGKLQEIKYSAPADGTLKVTKIGLDAGDLLNDVDTARGGDSTPLLNTVYQMGWTIIGTSADDIFYWNSPTPALATEDLFSGNDKFFGKGGNDVMRTYKGNDKAFGGAGNDTVFGDQGKDTLKGEGGQDNLIGGSGKDKLFGGKGSDTLEGGTGDDLLVGGGGADMFSFNEGAGNDTIKGFSLTQDTIRLDNEVSGIRIEAYAKGTRIIHSEGRIDLVGISVNQISESDIDGW